MLPRVDERIGDLFDFAGIDPSHDVGHRPLGGRRRQEERGKELGSGGVPEVAVGERSR